MNERDHDNFDEFAKEYQNIINGTLKISGAERNYFSEYKIKELLRYERQDAQMTMLDFGCGDGNSVVYMRELFPNATLFGTDVSELSIEEANNKKIPSAQFKPYNGTVLPYADNSLDVAFTSMVFHHIAFEHHERLCKEIIRVLKPGGRFYLFEHNPNNPVTRKIVRECEFDHDAILLPSKYSKTLLKTAGFRSLGLTFTLFYPRHLVFRWLLWTERLLGWVPMGAQYFVRAIK